MRRELRSLGYEDYGISKKRYMELRAVCQQYHEREAALHYGAKAISYSPASGSGASGISGDPTLAAAAHNLKIREKNDKIRQAAKQAAEGIPGLAAAILESVTEGAGYYSLSEQPLMAPADFYGYRRLFYHILDGLWG
ncbi:MAG: hypothetical protein IKG59_07265 [Firmicutes bacterium]|nr:hypothetical protein [Bacillota bacterium]